MEYKKIYDRNKIIQFHLVEYIGCCLEVNLNQESMAMKSLNDFNRRLQFLYRQNEFLNLKLRRFFCISLIQPHFNCSDISWHPLVSQGIWKKIQLAENKYIHFSLKLRYHIRAKES